MGIYSFIFELQKLIKPDFKKRLYGGKLHTFLRAGLRREQGSIDKLEYIVNSLERINTRDYLLSHSGPRNEVSALPSGCVVEINNTCNLDCAMCKTSLSTRPKQFMDLDVFERIVTKVKKANMTVESIHSTGDPLTNPRLRNYLDILRKHNMSVTLSSNFLLIEKHLDTIFEFRDVIHTIRPSIDGASKSVYEKIRCGGKWETLHRGLTKFADRNSGISNPFHVFVHSIISKDNFHEIALIPHVFSYLAPPTNFRFDFVNSIAPVNDYFLENNYFDDAYVVNAPCSLPWGSFYILCDGSLSACCQDYHGDLSFAEALRDDFENCYNSEFLKNLRAAMLAGNLEGMPRSCRNCFIVDPRFGDLINSIFSYFFLSVKKHPVYLQTALDQIGPKMKQGDFTAVLDIVKSL